MINQFLKIANVPDVETFYKKYKSEDEFFNAHPEASHLKTMARGGSAGAGQKQIMQLIQMYAQKSGSDPKQIMQQLQQMSPQQQQQTLQQMAQSMQGGSAQAGAQGMGMQQQGMGMQQPTMQQPGAMMAYGGLPLHAYGPGGPILPGTLSTAIKQTMAAAQPSTGGVGYQAAPLQQDYPDHESFSQAQDQYLQSLQGQANNPAPAPVVASAPQQTAAAPSTKLNDYQGASVYDFLTAQGKAGDFKSRKKLAQALGMSNYRGTASQNADMMQMIKQNPDLLNSYGDETAPQGDVTRTGAKTKNQNAAPTTQQLANAKHVAATGSSRSNTPYGMDYSGMDYNTIQKLGMPGSIPFGSGSIFEQIPVNQPRNSYMYSKPKYTGMKPEQRGLYDKAWNTFQKELESGSTHPYVPRSISDYYVTTEWDAALNDFKKQNGMAYGGYYGNVPQHGNPGVYADGTSGTFNGGQSFAFGGLLGDISNGMRDGSLTALAGSILPMANMYQDKLNGSPITGKMTKLDANGQPINDSNLKDELTKYLSNVTGDIKKEDLQAMVGKFASGGMTAQGYVPEYGSQAYGGFAYGGVPLPQYGMGAGRYPDGGEISPQDQEAMDMQQAQQNQQAPPQEGGAPQGEQQGGAGQINPQQVIQAVTQMLQQGLQPQEIIQKLVQMGIPQDQAQQLLQAVMQQMQGGQGQQQQGAPQQGPQEEMAEGAQGQEAPQQEAMEGQAPPMGRWGGRFAYGGFDTTMDTTQPPYGVGNLSKFVGSSMAEPSIEAMHEAAMQRSNVSRAGGYNDQVAQQYAQAASETAALNANHRMQRQMELEQMNRNQPYYNMDTNTGGLRQYPPMQMPQRQRPYAEGGSIGEEMDVTPEQMEHLRKQGYKFDII